MEILFIGFQFVTSRVSINSQFKFKISIFQIFKLIFVCQFFTSTPKIVHLTAAVASCVDTSNSDFEFNLDAFVQIVPFFKVNNTFVTKLCSCSFLGYDNLFIISSESSSSVDLEPSE
jgi:hypothetical protein